jgi:Ca2+-binding RTX toxin-like protein
MAKSYHQMLLPEKIKLAGPLAEAYYQSLHGNTISYQYSPFAIGLIDLENELFGSGGWAEGDSYTGIKNIIGTKYDDVIKGNSKNNYLFGDDGNDRLFGGKGNDK